MPSEAGTTSLSALLHSLARPAADGPRGREVEVLTGVLMCGGCGRWYPVEGGIPELLPDHLRDADRERPLFDRALAQAPPELRTALAAFVPSGNAASDPGAHYKRAEISIKSKIDDEGFWGPGYSSPFNPWNTDFTLYLLALFGTVAPMLAITRGQTLIDSGCGYAWSTEWFFKAGVNAIGVDICRTYLEIGIERIGTFRPHLVVGDVENLPFTKGSADAILAYESFHHIPDRRMAMAGYDRALRPGGTVVLAEPGGAHEAATVSVDAMEKYGILERGMELPDVEGYAAGTTFEAPEQLHMLRVNHLTRSVLLDEDLVRATSAHHCNFYRLVKKTPGLVPVRPEETAWSRFKTRARITRAIWTANHTR